MNLTLDAKIESFLFWNGSEVKKSELLDIFECTREDLEQALFILDQKLQNGGLVLLNQNDKISLATHPEMGPMLEAFSKAEYEKSLSKASLETLAIIIYKAPMRRSEIDYIRGVNSSTILRTLTIRGLVEKVADPQDERSVLYRPTHDLLRHLGIAKLDELPNYNEIAGEIRELLLNNEKNNEGEQSEQA